MRMEPRLPVVNGFWILFYATLGTRFCESDEFYEIMLNESRQLQENATGDPDPSPLLKQAQETTTARKVQGKVSHGVWLAFDIVFILETALNLVSDLVMEVTLCSQCFGCIQDLRGAKMKFGYFLGWKCLSAGLCYLACLVLAYFKSKNGNVMRLSQNRLEKSGGTGTIDAAVIFGMYRFYRNMDTLMNPSNQPWAQPAGQGTDGYPVQQGYPAAAGGGAGTSYPPYPVTGSETATESNHPYPTSAPQTVPSSYPPYPVAGSGRDHESRHSTRRKSSASLRGAQNL